MAPSLLVLGGGAFAAPVLRWAREAGLETVLTAPDARHPARKLAQAFHAIPCDDVEAHVALVRRLQREAVRSGSRLAGILPTSPETLALLAPLADAVPDVLPARHALERALAAERCHAFLEEQGFPLADGPSERPVLDVFAFFRDGAFVPTGIAQRRTRPGGETTSVQPAGLAPAAMHAAYVFAERVARALGLASGPLQVTLVERSIEFAFAGIAPGFTDILGATHVARLVYGKSPLQAWFAHLAGAGGPFDELALVPRVTAGWLALMPERAGLFAGVEGAAQARALPGVVDLWLEEPGRTLASPEIEHRPLACLWASGNGPREVEERLRNARAALTVRIAPRQRVA